jgi:hypothetical protein
MQLDKEKTFPRYASYQIAGRGMEFLGMRSRPETPLAALLLRSVWHKACTPKGNYGTKR